MTLINITPPTAPPIMGPSGIEVLEEEEEAEDGDGEVLLDDAGGNIATMFCVAWASHLQGDTEKLRRS